MSLPDNTAGKYHNDMLGMTSDTVLRITTLPGLMRVMLESDGWRRLVRPIDKRVFENKTIEDWILGEPWPGLHFPNWAMLYGILDKNIEDGPTCIALLLGKGAPTVRAAERKFLTQKVSQIEELPTREEQPGGRGNQQTSYNVTSLGKGNRSAYLAARIRRDYPDVFVAFERGEHKSVHAAAKAAGIVKVKTPLQQLYKLWEKVSPEDRLTFLRNIEIEK
jgi:hypothetical protein